MFPPSRFLTVLLCLWLSVDRQDSVMALFDPESCDFDLLITVPTIELSGECQRIQYENGPLYRIMLEEAKQFKIFYDTLDEWNSTHDLQQQIEYCQDLYQQFNIHERCFNETNHIEFLACSMQLHKEMIEAIRANANA